MGTIDNRRKEDIGSGSESTESESKGIAERVRLYSGELSTDRKTKLQIIIRLWSHVNDLLLYIEGNRNKPLDEIRKEIDLTECYCRPYADCDDDELYAADVARTAKEINH